MEWLVIGGGLALALYAIRNAKPKAAEPSDQASGEQPWTIEQDFKDQQTEMGANSSVQSVTNQSDAWGIISDPFPNSAIEFGRHLLALEALSKDSSVPDNVRQHAAARYRYGMQLLNDKDSTFRNAALAVYENP